MINSIDIRKLLNGDVRRAVHTTRYSRHAVHRVESVAEHIYNTMTYASVIAHHLQEDGYTLDHGMVLNKALWHDTEEPAGTGDILRSVKHSSPEILNLIEGLGHQAVRRVASELGVYQIVRHWESSKDDTTEGQIVRVADGLSVAAYLVEEYELGNHTMREVHDEFHTYLYDLQSKVKVPELQDLVREVQSYFEERVNYNNECPLCHSAATSR